MDLESQTSTDGTSRRSFLRKAGVAGGVAWVAPQVINATSAHAQVSDPDCVTIDDFQTEQFVQDSPGGPSASNTITGADGSSVLGGTRTLFLDAVGQNTGPSVASVGSGFFSVNTSNLQRTVGRLTYGPGPFDLSAVNRIEMKFNVEENTPAGDVVVTLSFNGIPQQRVIPAGDSVQTFFLNTYGIDKTNVTSISLEIDSKQQVVVGADTVSQCFQACPDGRFEER